MSNPLPPPVCLWSADVAGVHKGSGRRGRPPSQHSAAATSSFSQEYSSKDIGQLLSWSTEKLVFQSSCKHKKHKRLLSCQRIKRTSEALLCRVCRKQGSSLEKLLYLILNQLACIYAFAVEAYAVSGEIQHEGETVNLGRHSWDVLTIDPAKLLIEVQGQQHSTKLMTKRNCRDSSLSSRASRDRALAKAAVEAGFYVLWLDAGEERGRKARWTAAIKQVLSDMADKKPPQLYTE